MTLAGQDDVAFALSVLSEERARYLQNLNLNFNGRAENFDLRKHALWTCSYDHFNSHERIFEAIKAQAADKNVLILGDSVGRDTLHALRLVHPDTNFLMLHQSCCPPGHFRNPKRESGCFEGLPDMLSMIQDVTDISAIIMNYRYRPKDWAHILPTLPVVRDMCANVVMMGVAPVFTKTIPKYIAEIGRVPRHIDRHDPDMIPWDFNELTSKAQEMAEQHGIPFIDTRDFHLVDDKYPLWMDDTFEKPIYWDEIHLTRHSIPTFATYLGGKKGLEFLREL